MSEEKVNQSKFVVGDIVVFHDKLYRVTLSYYEEYTGKFLYDVESVVDEEKIVEVYERWLQPKAK